MGGSSPGWDRGLGSSYSRAGSELTLPCYTIRHDRASHQHCVPGPRRPVDLGAGGDHGDEVIPVSPDGPVAVTSSSSRRHARSRSSHFGEVGGGGSLTRRITSST